jgi:hypothetical protein
MMLIPFLIDGARRCAEVAADAAERLTPDARNVTRLAEHFGWGRADAAEAYALARRTGFGAAYRSVRSGRQPAAV